ncbi:MAG: hypothetical protein ACODUE_12840 [Synechococcus sp.]
MTLTAGASMTGSSICRKPCITNRARQGAGKKTGFVAKISISDDNGFVDVDRISWDNYNEANDLIMRAEQYKEERGYYPARIHADSIYMTFENKKFCTANDIRLSSRPRKRQIQAEVQTDSRAASAVQIRPEEAFRD